MAKEGEKRKGKPEKPAFLFLSIKNILVTLAQEKRFTEASVRSIKVLLSTGLSEKGSVHNLTSLFSMYSYFQTLPNPRNVSHELFCHVYWP